MLWLLIALVAATVAGGVGYLFDSGSWTRDTCASPAFWTILVLLGIPAIWLNFHLYSNYKVERETYNYLQNVGDSNGTRGSFSLFGGSIDNQPVYMYYLQDDSGKFRLYHVDADSAYVTYTNETPKIVYHSSYSRNIWMSYNPDDGAVDEFEFRVPEGSVKQNYNLDAQ